MTPTAQAGQSSPILYSFRRCPYAMRARMAIKYSQIKVQLREVVLKDKPPALLSASAKATVPVLVLANGSVIDESLEIMHWSLNQHDPDNWLLRNRENGNEKQKQMHSLISHNDNIFKTHLDHYKYSDRFPEHSSLYYRQQAECFLQQLESSLKQNIFLVDDKPSLADIALFPFIRQFAYVNIKWFDNSPYSKLVNWLHYWLDCELFSASMNKYKPWHEEHSPVYF